MNNQWPKGEKELANEFKRKRPVTPSEGLKIINHRSDQAMSSAAIEFIAGLHEGARYNDYDIGWLLLSADEIPRLCLYNYVHDEETDEIYAEVWEMQENQETNAQFLDRVNATNPEFQLL